MNDTCRVYHDLMPYFYDDSCPRDLAVNMEKHLRTCPDCRAEFERIGGRFDSKGNPRVKQRLFRKTITTAIGIITMVFAATLLTFALVHIIGIFSSLPSNPFFKPDFGQLTGNGAVVSIGLVVGIAIVAVILIILWKIFTLINKKLFPVRAPEFVTYTVQQGDTLLSIAETHLGDGTRLSQLKLLNDSIEQAPVGRELRIELASAA